MSRGMWIPLSVLLLAVALQPGAPQALLKPNGRNAAPLILKTLQAEIHQLTVALIKTHTTHKRKKAGRR